MKKHGTSQILNLPLLQPLSQVLSITVQQQRHCLNHSALISMQTQICHFCIVGFEGFDCSGLFCTEFIVKLE